MATIFPLNPQINDLYEGYRWNGSKWTVVGIDLTADYPEITGGYISASVIPTTIARVDYVDSEISSIDLSPYLTASSASTTYSTITYVDTEISNIDALPSQTGNGGKFLGTDGSIASWESVDALPSQSTHSGQFLTTDGSSASWATVDLTSAINTASAAAVSYLVDSAPQALDTLNELAAALGDDANYASTVTAALGNKLDSSSASTTYAPLISPSLTTPNIGVATGTSLSTTGNIVGHIEISTPTFSSNSYTIAASDNGKLLLLDNSSTAGTLYIPTDATYNFTIGTQITAVQKGSGQITVAATTPATTTVNATPGLLFRTQWSSATIIKIASDTWLVMGDMEAA